MNEDVEFIKTFVETMLLSEICEQDTIQGNGKAIYSSYDSGKIDALRQVLKIIELRESK